MVFGRDIRLSRILNNGKMLCIPMDHGITNGPIKGLENIHDMIYQCASAGLSCVLVNKGIIKSMPRSPEIGLIVHFSASTSIGPAPNRKMLIGSVPLVAMMYPRGENIKNPHDPEIVAHAARVGAEAGADIVKAVYTGDPDSFKHVVRSCPVPLVIAGGPKANSDREILEMCNGAMAAGAKGVTFGRNIFQHKNPPAMVRALRKIIIENRNVREALKELE